MAPNLSDVEIDKFLTILPVTQLAVIAVVDSRLDIYIG